MIDAFLDFYIKPAKSYRVYDRSAAEHVTQLTKFFSLQGYNDDQTKSMTQSLGKLSMLILY